MSRRGSASRIVHLGLAVAAFCALTAAAGCAGPGSLLGIGRPLRVLLIGNSMTYYNGGIDAQLNAFTPTVNAAQVTRSKYRLRDHWTDGTALRAIRENPYPVVVLQDHSQAAVLDAQEYRQYVEAFDQEVRSHGGRSVLLETWQTPEGLARGVTTAELDAATRSVGGELSIPVAPAGLAFERSQQQRPDLGLTLPDGHPTPSGTYLAACVLYGTILNRSPEGISDTGFLIRSPFWVAPEDRAFLRRIAAETLGY